MPDDIIDKIHRMAQQQKNNPGLIFADRNLNPDEYDDDDDDDDDETYRDDDDDNPDDDNDEPYHHNDNNDDDDDDDDDESYHHNDDSDDDDEEDNDDNDNHDGDEGGVDNNDDNASDGIANDRPMVDTPKDSEVEGDEPLIEDIPPPNDVVEQPDNPPGEIPGVGAVDHEGEVGADHVGVNDETRLGIPGVDDNGDDGTVDEQSETPPDLENSTVGGYGLRNRQGRDYNHRYAGEDFVVGDDTGITLATRGNDEVLETPQMSLKAGLRTFGDDGMKAVEKEMRQLHDRYVMKPVHKNCLTPEQQKEALAYLMFLRRKRCGKIKGCGCADGQKQRAYITKEDSTAPTAARRLYS